MITHFNSGTIFNSEMQVQCLIVLTHQRLSSSMLLLQNVYIGRPEHDLLLHLNIERNINIVNTIYIGHNDESKYW